MMIDNRVNVAKKLRETPEKLAKENFYDDVSYKIEPLLFEIVYEIIRLWRCTKVACSESERLAVHRI